MNMLNLIRCFPEKSLVWDPYIKYSLHHPTFHKGVICVWSDGLSSEDDLHDFIEGIPDLDRERLLVAVFHKGNLFLMWRGVIPRDYQREKDIDAPNGDVWYIWESHKIGLTL